MKRKSECQWSEKTCAANNHKCQQASEISGTVVRAWSTSSKEAHLLDIPNKRVRRLHYKEIAAIQSFPLDWFDIPEITLKDRIAAIGNAVPPRFAHALMCSVRTHLEEHNIPLTSVELCAGGGDLH